MLRSSVGPWTKFMSAYVGKVTVVRPLALVEMSSGKTAFFSSMERSTSRRSQDDERIDQTSYSDVLDESDALEMGKQRKGAALSENEIPLAERVSFWKMFSSDWLLQQPRGDSFAPFYFGGRDPFVFHDTFLAVLLAKQKQKPLPPEVRRPDVVSSSDDILQTNFSDAFDESDWVETGKQKKVTC